MLEFGEALRGSATRVERDLNAARPAAQKVLATVVRLLDKTLIRVGNDEYARENRSFGLTTLRRPPRGDRGRDGCASRSAARAA